MFAPEEMLLVAGSPSLRREALDRLAGQRSPAYLRDLATYGRALQQRNGLLRLIREEQATRAELRFWDGTLLEAGQRRARGAAAAAGGPRRARWRRRTPRSPPTRRPPGRLRARPTRRTPRSCPGESVRDALARRLAETAEKEVWNGTTLIGPHRDDLVFEMGGRPLASFASRGQQRTAILAFKLAELDLLTALDGRPAAAPARRRVLRARPGAPRAPRPPDRGAAAGVRHDDDARRPRPGPALGGHDLVGRRWRPATRPGCERDELTWLGRPRRRRDAGRPARVGDLLPDAARQLGLEDELRLARAIATWDAIVAERVPPAAGACRLDRGRARRDRRRGRRADRGGGAAHARDRAAGRVRGRPGGARARELRLRIDRRRAFRDGREPPRIIRCPADGQTGSRLPSPPQSTRVAPTMRLVSWPSASS